MGNLLWNFGGYININHKLTMYAALIQHKHRICDRFPLPSTCLCLPVNPALNIYSAHPEQDSIIYLQERIRPNPLMEYKWNMVICIPDHLHKSTFLHIILSKSCCCCLRVLGLFCGWFNRVMSVAIVLMYSQGEIILVKSDVAWLWTKCDHRTICSKS